MRGTVGESAFGHRGECVFIESVLVKIPACLHREVLGGDHHAGAGVPLTEAVGRRVGTERTARMLVETHNRHHVGAARGQHVGSGRQGDATCGATVLDRGERNSGQAQARHQRVRFAGHVAATDRGIHIGPADTCIRERRTQRVLAHVHTGDTLVPPEGVHTRANDVDVLFAHDDTLSDGTFAKAKVNSASLTSSRHSST